MTAAGRARPSFEGVRAFMSIKTQFDNAGDAWINRELARLLADRVPTAIDFSRCPAAFRRAMGVESLAHVVPLERFGFARLLGRVLAARLTGKRCYYFLNPGGLGRTRTLRQLLNAAGYTTLLTLLRIAGVRLCYVGVSYGKLDRLQGFLMRRRARLLHVLAVRDQATLDYLRGMGVRRLALAPDLSFGVRGGGAAPAGGETKIAFSFRADQVPGGLDALAEFTRRVRAHFGRSARYLYVAQVGRDIPAMQALFEQGRAEGFGGALMLTPDDVGRTLDAYRGCSVLYSNRLHALLAAAHAGVAPCAVANPGEPGKISALFATLGIEGRIQTLDAAAPPLLPAPVPAQLLSRQNEMLERFFDDLLSGRTVAEPGPHAARAQPAPLRLLGEP